MSPDDKPPLAPEDQPPTAGEAGDEANDPAELDLDARVLCSDGACIGVIGPDGRCKECGKPFVASSGPDADGPPAAKSDEDLADDDPGDEEVADDDDHEIPLDGRVLCSDGSCIGVIGPDGRCKECGNPYEGSVD